MSNTATEWFVKKWAPRNELEAAEFRADLVRVVHLFGNALRELTSNRFHDFLCQCAEEWENEHAIFDRAKALVEPKP